jgi:hypothetical protein
MNSLIFGGQMMVETVPASLSQTGKKNNYIGPNKR